MNHSTKYTKSILEPIVNSSFSLAEVMRKLTIKWSGGQQQNIKRWIAIYELDTSHFLGQRVNQGKNHKGGLRQKTWQEILVVNKPGSRRVVAVLLRRALIESGRKYECELCTQGNKWNNLELRLQVDHINSDWNDNRLENIRFICPNCHSQRKHKMNQGL